MRNTLLMIFVAALFFVSVLLGEDITGAVLIGLPICGAVFSGLDVWEGK